MPGSTSAEQQYELTMVVAHPSAMRKGAVLEERVRAAPIAPVAGIRRSEWSNGYFNVFPLPLLSTVVREQGLTIENRGWCALLELAAPVQSSLLDIERRVACLAPEGIHLLLQRLVHADTRFPVRTDLLASVFEPKLDELELLETWCEELGQPRVSGGEELANVLTSEAAEFEAFLATPHGTETIRSLLENRRSAGEARTAIYAELRRRRRA